jgi:hypothetical protein
MRKLLCVPVWVSPNAQTERAKAEYKLIENIVGIIPGARAQRFEQTLKLI